AAAVRGADGVGDGCRAVVGVEVVMRSEKREARIEKTVRPRGRRGSAVLDMALVLPILLALAFGTVGCGYLFYVKSNLEAAGRARGRRGSAVLEMALVLPILLALAFGTVEFGYFFYVKHNLQAAAREGCRAAIVPSSQTSDVTTAVANVMTAAGLNSSGYTTS